MQDGTGNGMENHMHRLTRTARRRALQALLTLLPVLTTPTGARAQDGDLGGGALGGANQAQFWAEDSSRAATYLDRFDLQYARGPWTVAARLVFDEESRIDPRHFQGIKRRFVEYRGETGALRAGTFYATLGGGLLLRAEEDDAVRLDRDIDGVLGSLAWRALDGQAFVGRPRNDITYERDDLLSGAEFGVRALRGLRLGAGYVRQDADPADFAGTQTGNRELIAGSPVEELFGGNLQWSRGALGAVFDGARRRVWGVRDSRVGWIGAHDRDGEAYYGAFTLGVPGYTLLLEGKSYSNFNAPYSTLPPANSAGTPINNGLDERGVGAMLTMSPTVDWLCQAAASYAQGDDDPGERTSAEGSVRRDWLGRGGVKLGGEWTEEQELQSHAYRRYYGPTIETIYYLTATSSLTLHGRAQSWINEVRNGRRDEYTEVGGDLSLAFDPSRAATLSVTKASRPVGEFNNHDTWITLEFAWMFGYDHDLKVKFGDERGGVTCSGGVCHYEPSFSGVRLEFNSRF
jgi:hypothetical protein